MFGTQVPECDWLTVQRHNSNSLSLFRNTAGLWEERHPACDSQVDFNHSTVSPPQKPSLVGSPLSAIPQTPTMNNISGNTNSIAATTSPSELEEENSLLCEEDDLQAAENLDATE
mmetsp:Transcript_12848/g.15978  ORF Transcript_12848/g.15978 Transcript_12848/m.15978 type:complete len:115 (-) Transcript_12848:709-1053(-)